MNRDNFDHYGFEEWIDSETGYKYCELYTKNGEPHRVDGPARTTWNPELDQIILEWFQDGVPYREDGGPALVERSLKHEDVTQKQYFENGKLVPTPSY